MKIFCDNMGILRSSKIQMLITFHLMQWPNGCACINAHLVTLIYLMNQMEIYKQKVMSEEIFYLTILTSGKPHKNSLISLFCEKYATKIFWTNIYHICRMHIFGTVIESVFWKKSKAQIHIWIDEMLHSGFSQENALGEGDLMLVKYISGNCMPVKNFHYQW